uniref:Uncharacterized protein n=1 Tax=Setaria italica TaxID=4555 RepID=K3XX80_SETIT
MVKGYVLAEVQVPVVEIRLPRAGGHVWLHERVEVPDPLHLRCATAVSTGEPQVHVLDVVQHAGAVRERRRRLRDAADRRAVGVQDHDPRVGPREPGGEDVLPRVPADGLADVVGGHLGVGARGGGPVQDVLHSGAGAHAKVRHRLDPGHLLAVRAVHPHPELPEAAPHHRQERVARAEVQGLEGRGLHDAEALAAAASDGPEHVVSHGVLVQEPPLGIHKHGVQDVVSGEAVLAEQRAEAAAAEVSPDADGRAQAGRESQLVARLCDGVVELAERRAGVHPRGGVLLVDTDAAEVGQVDHGERLRAQGPVGQALVVVPAAAHAEADAVPAAADHGGLHVGGVRGRDDPERPHRCRCGEPLVPDGGHQHRGERRRALRVHELAGDARREALEEVVRGSVGRDEGVATENGEDEHRR